MIPKLYEITLPFLEFMKDQKPRSRSEIRVYLADHFNLTEEDKNKLTPGAKQKVFQNRVDWARFELRKGGLIETIEKMYKITKEGLEILQNKPERIDRKFLLQIPKYYEHHFKEKNEEDTTNIDENTSPEDKIIAGYIEYKQNLKSEILDKIKDNPPEFFEQLVIDLIEKLGYGKGTATGKSGDGGIDGLIDEDTLGLGQIYLQAKRWRGTVPIKEIRDFAGMLDSKKSKKGIFITTSDFSNECREFIKTTSSKIVLINGEKLAELMFEFDVGFSPRETYHLKIIDEDYFS